jgi:hypothetical protein
MTARAERRLGAIRLIVLGLLACTGCRDAPQAPAPSERASSARPETTTSASAGAPPALDPSAAARVLAPSETLSITLDDPGSEPRRKLRHRPALGDKRRLALKADVQSIVARASQRSSLRYQVDAEVTAATEDGCDVRVSIVAASADDAPADDAQERDAIAALVGLAGTMRIDGGGAVIRGIDGVGKGASLQLFSSVAAAMRDAVAPLPGEPVGKNARWRAVDRIWRGGAALLRTTRFRLEEDGRDGLRISGAVSEQPLADGLPDPALPLGVSVRALTGIGSGKRRIAWRDGALFPIAADSEVASDLRLEVSVVGPTGVARSVETVRITQLLTLLDEAEGRALTP